jgi:DNA-binding CsgD family transcriptional regulator
VSLRLPEFAELLGLFFEGLVDARRWEDFLNQSCARLNCESGGLSFHDLQNKKPRVGASVGLTGRQIADYESYYGSLNPIAPVATASARRVGFSYSVNHLTLHREFLQSEYYQDFLRPHRIFHSAMGTAVIESRYVASLNVARSRTSGPLGKDAAQFIQLISPQIARAFRIQTALDSARAAAEVSSVALDRWDTGVIAIDRDAHVIRMNSAAEKILKTSRSLTISNDKLVAVESGQQTIVERLISGAIGASSGRATEGGGAIQLRGRDGAPISVVIAPFRSSHLFAEGQAYALVFLADVAAKPLSRRGMLRVLFGLTPSESRLVGLLLEGMELKSAADHLRVTNSTARFMLKQVFHKTATHRQSQLVRLMSSLPGDSDLKEPAPVRSITAARHSST